MGNRSQPRTGLLSCLVTALASSTLAQTTSAATAAATVAATAATAAKPAPNYAALNTTLGGTLQKGVPLAEPCYSNYAGTKVTPNAAQCSSVESGYDSELFIEQNFGGYENSNWAMCQSSGQSCALNFSNPAQPLASSSVCYQGSVPNHYIPVSKVADVQAGIAFASTSGVPLVVKGSGHDYKGRSSGPGSLALWMYTYKPAITLTQGFVPDGCPAAVGDGVTVPAGHDLNDVYQFADAQNVTVVGGSALSVHPTGGWLTGGGHSALTPTMGLGVDNALQIRAVLPNGTYVTANRCQHQDLFFALRGGGGNAFGVIMEATHRAHPKVSLQVAFIAFTAASQTAFNNFIHLLTQNANTWGSQGWGGYISFGGSSALAAGMVMFNPVLNNSAATASMASVMAYAASNASASTLVDNIFQTTSFWQAYQNFILPSEEKVGIGGLLASRLIPKTLLSTSTGQNQVAQAILNVTNLMLGPGSLYDTDPESAGYSAPVEILATTPYSYTALPGESFSDSSVTPYWRSSTWHVAAAPSFANSASVSTIVQAAEIAHAAGDVLRTLAPNSGAYQNEAEIFEPDPIDTFWGSANYKTLSAFKAKIDPGNVLTCWGCIGWKSSDSRYSCYPQVPSCNTDGQY